MAASSASTVSRSSAHGSNFDLDLGRKTSAADLRLALDTAIGLAPAPGRAHLPAAEPEDGHIQFADYVLEKLPFQVQEIQTDNGPEFGTSFHYHLRDNGVGHRRA